MRKNNIMHKFLENSGVALFILIVTIIGTSFTVILKLDTTSNAVDDVKSDMKDMSNDRILEIYDKQIKNGDIKINEI